MIQMDDQLDQIAMRTEQLIDICRKVLRRQGGDRLVAAYLYGSVLGARHRPDSDLDIAILDREDDRVSWEAQAELMDQLERATGQGVDMRMLREGTLAYQVHVVEQGRLIWSRDDEAVQAFAHAINEEHERCLDQRSQCWISLVGTLARRAGNP